MSQTARQPNVVIVLADDLGWGDLSCYGATRIATPNIDRLAEQGSRFIDAHAASAVCSPSRYALLTARYSWRTPLKKRVLMGHAPALIESDRPTLGSVFQQAGYRTAAIGKWHLGLGWKQKDGTVWSAFREADPLELEGIDVGIDFQRSEELDRDYGDSIDYHSAFEGGPLALGFDRFFGIAGSLDMPPYAFLSQDRTVGQPVHEKRKYLTEEQRRGLQAEGWDEREVDLTFTREAVQFIRDAGKDKPFLLYFAPSAPHRPQVPPEFLEGSTEAGARGDSVAFVDWMTGQLVAELKEQGVFDDTIFIFTSDNGAPTVFDDGDTTIHQPNGPWRGQKGDIWDGGHREPLVIRWPGHVPAGAVRENQVGLIDLLPSLASLAEVPMPPGAAPDGTDVSPVILGGDTERGKALVHHSMGGAFAIRSGQWKAIFASGSGVGFSQPHGRLLDREDGEGQLYDLEADPDERNNLWSRHPDIVANLYRELTTIVDSPDNGLHFDIPLAHR